MVITQNWLFQISWEHEHHKLINAHSLPMKLFVVPSQINSQQYVDSEGEGEVVASVT